MVKSRVFAVAVLRRNARGRVRDGDFSLIHEWYHRDHLTISEIARRLNIQRSTVRYNLTTTVPPSQRTALHCPPVLPARHARLIKKRREIVKKLVTKKTEVVGTQTSGAKRTKIIMMFPSPAAISRQLTRVYKIAVSSATVRRDLAFLGFRAIKRRRSPIMSDACKAERVAFCTEMLERDDLDLFMFSDEKYFDSNDHGIPWQWCKPGQKPENLGKEGKSKVTCHMWGVIGSGGRRHMIIFKEDTYKHVNRYVYMKECLTPAMRVLRRRGVVFQYDGASPHKAKETKEFMKNHGIKYLPNWPAHSPDLNPIENLWSILARAVSDRGPWGYDELSVFIQEEWDKIPASVIDNLVMSFRRRCEECIRRKGNTVC